MLNKIIHRKAMTYMAFIGLGIMAGGIVVDWVWKMFIF